MAKSFKVECPHCKQLLEVEVPKAEKGKRGIVSDIPLDQMTLEQVKIELRNAKSVLYKSEKAGVDEEKLVPKRARVAAAQERYEALKPAPVASATAVAVAVTEGEADPEIDTETAEEI